MFVYVHTCPCMLMQKLGEGTAWFLVTHSDTLWLSVFHLETVSHTEPELTG